jgi:DNA polymerase III epsilon subunit-like protein
MPAPQTSEPPMTTVFLDTETLGLHPHAPIWEFAAIRIDDNGQEVAREHFQIRHYWTEDAALTALPRSFRADYLNRYSPLAAINPHEAAKRIHAITRTQAEIAGSNPAFDTEKLDLLLRGNGIVPDWHYHPLDVPAVAIGWLAARGELIPRPRKSDALSRAVGVNPDHYQRHTALGDVLWCRALHDAMLSEVRS